MSERKHPEHILLSFSYLRFTPITIQAVPDCKFEDLREVSSVTSNGQSCEIRRAH